VKNLIHLFLPIGFARKRFGGNKNGSLTSEHGLDATRLWQIALTAHFQAGQFARSGAVLDRTAIGASRVRKIQHITLIP
jgi:hypothetical protein